MTSGLMQSLEENWLFRARKPHDFNARDIADLAFLYMVTLHILRCEFETAPQAIKYAKFTNIHNNFKTIDRMNTDLYQFLNILNDTSGPVSQQLANQSANHVLWGEIRFNPSTVKQFLSNVSASKYDNNAQKRLLLQIESQLHVTVSNYRSIRRIAVEWNGPLIYGDAKKLAITRLLQALRFKARRGDLLPSLEILSSKKSYEILQVCNVETGAGCEPEKTVPKKHSMGLLKSLALGALAGGLITHYMGSKK